VVPGARSNAGGGIAKCEVREGWFLPLLSREERVGERRAFRVVEHWTLNVSVP